MLVLSRNVSEEIIIIAPNGGEKVMTDKPRNKGREVKRPQWPHLFLTVSAMGVCVKVGKAMRTLVNYGYKRRIGDKKRPLSSLFVPVLDEASELASWPTDEDMLADFHAVKHWAEHQIKANKEAIAKEKAAKNTNDTGEGYDR